MKKKSAYGWTMGLALAATFAGGWSCGASETAPAVEEPRAIPESSAAQARVEELRVRFLLPTAPPLGPPSALPRAMHGSSAPGPVLGAAVASGFELRDGSLRAVIPSEARQRVKRPASVALPLRACDPVQLEDDASHVAVSFALRGASGVAVTAAGGVAVYAGALDGADVLHRVHAEGTEDYVAFEERPQKEELAYSVDVSRVAGLRLVSNTLEFLDERGAPRLRVAPPFVVDAKGRRTEGALALEGCAFDASPRAPWRRAVTSPGASRCGVRVTWKAAAYPAVVDPSWTATGSMTTARETHTATLLGSGEVLVAGGGSSVYLSSAELYDPAAGTFAATGSMTEKRRLHTATLLGSGKVLVAGGDGGIALSSAELYDPTVGTFTATGSMKTGRYYHTATPLGSGDVLVAGGCTGDCSGGSAVASAELYDPTAGTFTVTGPMTAGRLAHTATLLDSGEVLIAGGFGSTDFTLSSAELYDPTVGTFAATGSMTAVREDHTATLLGSGEVLVAGGALNCSFISCDTLSSAELYGPMTGTFAATGSMTTARGEQTATLLGSGEVLVAGGAGTASDLSSAELYDPTAGTFANTASMTSPRAAQTATLLGSGEVLVAGGAAVGSPLSSAELFSCAPLTACPAGDNCGTLSAACDGTLLTCGPSCSSPQTCGGGGTPNVCGCTAATTCPAGDNCGTLPDGCGGTVACGTCGSGQTCTSNRCVSVDAGTDSGPMDSGGDSGAKDSGSDSGASDSGTSTQDSGPEDSGTGSKDSGTLEGDSGAGGKDSGAMSHDSGPSRDSASDASDRSGNPSNGCGCRTARVQDAPFHALLSLGVLGMTGVLRRRARPFARSRSRPHRCGTARARAATLTAAYDVVSIVAAGDPSEQASCRSRPLESDHRSRVRGAAGARALRRSSCSP